MAMLTFYWIPELLPSFVFCENQMFATILSQVGPGGLPPGEGSSQQKRDASWAVPGKGGACLSSPGCPVGRGVRGAERRRREKNEPLSSASTEASPVTWLLKLRSPQRGLWHLLLVKTMHRVWGFVSLCLLFFSNSRAKMSLLGYCISNLLHLSLHLSG